jgi:O-antigen/teichoic acid export membrane protein
MQKRFVSGILVSLSMNLLIKPFSVLVIDAGIQRALGNVVYGKYFALLSLTLITNVLLDLGINNFTVRNIAQDEKRMTHHLNNIVLFRMAMFLIYSIIVLLFAYFFDLIQTNETVLFLLIFNQFLVQSIALLRSFFAGQHRFFLDSLLSVLDRALLILVVGFAFLQFPSWITIDFFVLIQCISYLITLLVGLFFIRHSFRWSAITLNSKYIKGVLLESLPYSMLVLFMLIYNRADTLLIRLMAEDGAYEAGIYAQGFRLYDALYMVGFIFASVLFPMFSRMLHQKDPQINDLILVSTRWLVGGVIAIVFVAIENADALLALLYKDQVTESSSFVFIGLMLAFLAMSFNFIFGTLLTANGSLKILNLISGIAAFVSVALNTCLIPSYGAKGSVLIAVFIQVMVSSFLVYKSYKAIAFRSRFVDWSPLVLYTIYLSCFYFLLPSFPVFIVPFFSVFAVVFGALWFSVLDLNNIYRFLIKKEVVQ